MATTTVELPEMAYVIIETEKDNEGNFIPCLVKRGEKGYFKTNYQWGKDKIKAEKTALEMNQKMGVSREDMFRLLGQSFPSKEDVYHKLDRLRAMNSEHVLEWIRENVHPNLDMVAEANPADITDWTLEWD